MTLQTAGTSISLSQLAGEFHGAASPVRFSDYYRGSSNIVPDTPVNALVPTSGTIQLSEFYGTDRRYPRVYTSNSFWTVPSNVTRIGVLVVGGGGGGGSTFGGGTWDGGGGGGAGGVIYSTCTPVTPGATVALNIGTGGSGGYRLTCCSNQVLTSSGGCTTITDSTGAVTIFRAYGGGYGGGYTPNYSVQPGSPGGSGGGSNGSNTNRPGGSATQPPTGYGNPGGAGYDNGYNGGGGGAGSAGQPGTPYVNGLNPGAAGNGGDGLTFYFSGQSFVVGAGGGAGGSYAHCGPNPGGSGGLIGGGAGGTGANGYSPGSPAVISGCGTQGYGSGGGGGGGHYPCGGGNGGNGTPGVIILYY